jgi:TPR repeat protein
LSRNIRSDPFVTTDERSLLVGLRYFPDGHPKLSRERTFINSVNPHRRYHDEIDNAPTDYPAAGLLRDREKAFQLYARAAKLGSSQAHFYLGDEYIMVGEI